MSLAEQETSGIFTHLENDPMIRELTFLIDVSDPTRETSSHMKRVARSAAALGDNLGLSDEEIKILYISGRLHDIGKRYCPDIVKSDKPLSQVEKFIINRHPVDSLKDIMERAFHSHIPLRPIQEIGFIALTHHRNFIEDEDRYPDMDLMVDAMEQTYLPMEFLEDERLAKLSIIHSICDAKDALTSSHGRAYRRIRLAEEGFQDQLSDVDVMSIINSSLILPDKLSSVSLSELLFEDD